MRFDERLNQKSRNREDDDRKVGEEILPIRPLLVTTAVLTLRAVAESALGAPIFVRKRAAKQGSPFVLKIMGGSHSLASPAETH